MKPDEKSSWEYKPDDPASADFDAPDDNKMPAASAGSASKGRGVSWTASEYIEHERGAGWYGALVAGIVVLTVAVYFITKDLVATTIIPIVGVIVGVFAGQKPREITYELNDSGIKIGEKPYAYTLFKSFSVMREGALNSVNFNPLKRFMPPISIYFEAKDEKRIVDAIGDHLPYEERQMDGIDKLSRRLKL